MKIIAHTYLPGIHSALVNDLGKVPLPVNPYLGRFATGNIVVGCYLPVPTHQKPKPIGKDSFTIGPMKNPAPCSMSYVSLSSNDMCVRFKPPFTPNLTCAEAAVTTVNNNKNKVDFFIRIIVLFLQS